MKAGLPALLALLVPTSARAGTPLPVPSPQPGSGIQMSITSFFSEPPPAGVLPLEIRIENASRRPGTWDLRFVSSKTWPQDRLESRHALDLDAGSARTFQVLVPLVYRIVAAQVPTRVTLVVRGPGIARGETTLFNRSYAPPSASSRFAATPYVGMSEGLVVSNWEPLGARLAGRGHGLFGSRFDAAVLPSDWRGYAAFATLWITDEEWSAVALPARGAILQWVGLGGHLLIASPRPDEPPSGLPERATGDSLGFGRISIVGLDGAQLVDLDAAATAALDPRYARRDQLGRYENWSLLTQLGRPVLPAKLLVLLLGGYGLVLAPLNLFLCRRSDRRARLFWTTPLISLVTAAALAALILFDDGTGGHGRRWTAVFIDPAAHQAFVVQEQVARTGVLFSPGFDSAEPLSVEGVSVHGTAAMRMLAPLHLSVQSSRYHGDWFMNRSVQGHFVETIRPTRARVEIGAPHDGRLAVMSTVAGTIEELFVADREGRFWRGRAIAVGRPGSLHPATEKEFDAWWTFQVASAGPRGQAIVRPLGRQRGSFFATLAGGEGAIDTSPAIRWAPETVLVMGRGVFREAGRF